MTVLHDTKAAYDAVATVYAERFSNILDTLPMERAMLAAFADLVRTGPVADLGCGPGHVTAHLHALGLTAFGIDLSTEMVAMARRAHPDLRFDEGSMTALDLADGVLGGILAFYSIIHTPPKELPVVFTEFHRVLAPGGHLLLGFFAGDDPLPREFDHKVTLAYRWSPDSLMELLRQAGFVEVARLRREPHEGERPFHHVQLLVRKRDLIAADRNPTMQIRAAKPDEAAILSDLALRSKAHWGYDEAFLRACRAELTLRPDDVAAQRATVAQDGDRVVGFYTLNGQAPEGELGCLYVEPAHIGSGIGSRLWHHAVDTARTLNLKRFTIDADPYAEDFYQKMGAVRIGSVPSGSIPGRLLPQMAYHLS